MTSTCWPTMIDNSFGCDLVKSATATYSSRVMGPEISPISVIYWNNHGTHSMLLWTRQQF